MVSYTESLKNGPPLSESRIRAIVREEIGQALGALGRAADDLDMPYETAEIDSRVYSGAAQVAQRALSELIQCWTEGHEFKSIWNKPLETCRRCGAPVPTPVNPFEEETDG